MSGSVKIQPEYWREFYAAAFGACGDKTVRQLKASAAMTVCIRRLLEISPDAASERKAIRMALDDVQILTVLYRKYG
jgi:hypothetical protein